MRDWRPCSVNNFIQWLWQSPVSCLWVVISGTGRAGQGWLAIHWTLSARRLSLVEKLDPITHQQTAWHVSSFIHSLQFKADLASAEDLYVSLTGTGTPRACQRVLSRRSCGAEELSLCWFDFSEAVLLTQLQNSSWWSHPATWCEQKAALPKQPADYRVKREPRAERRLCLHVYSRRFAKKFHCSYV